MLLTRGVCSWATHTHARFGSPSLHQLELFIDVNAKEEIFPATFPPLPPALLPWARLPLLLLLLFSSCLCCLACIWKLANLAQRLASLCSCCYVCVCMCGCVRVCVCAATLCPPPPLNRPCIIIHRGKWSQFYNVSPTITTVY